MNTLFLCLLIMLNGIEYANADQTPGFQVQIRPGSEQEKRLDVFLDLTSLRDFPRDTVFVKGKDDKPDREWIGVNLCWLLENKLNLPCRQIKQISISAPDGYTSLISGEFIPALETGICAYQIKGEQKWPAKYGYMRLIFPQLHEMNWVNQPDKMIIDIGDSQQPMNSYAFYFLENENISRVVQQDLQGNPYIAIDDILFALNAPQQQFSLMTQDSLFRDYSDDRINRRLVLCQEQICPWKLTGIAVPMGLKTRSVFLFATQNKILFLKSLSASEQDVFYVKFFHPILKNLQSTANISMDIVLHDGRRIPADVTELVDGRQLYQHLERQWKIYTNIDHVLVTID